MSVQFAVHRRNVGRIEQDQINFVLEAAQQWFDQIAVDHFDMDVVLRGSPFGYSSRHWVDVGTEKQTGVGS